MALAPFEWRDKPALIEHLFPVQKISAESYKEQMANQGKTLTALGSYWKGRKPLILNKACILGSLLPATDDPLKDLEIFELLMGLDSVTMQKRIEATLPASRRHTVGEYLLLPFNDQVRIAKRSEELGDSLFNHVWSKVNQHLGTSASSYLDLVEQIGIARFGRRPRLADTFSGSGQIPFEAARLGCDVYASDINPVACMLTWGGLNIVGGYPESRNFIAQEQKVLAQKIQQVVDQLGIEANENGWKPRVFLYCMEVRCPQTGWMVPLLPTRILSKDQNAIVELIPIKDEKRYEIQVKIGVTGDELIEAAKGTVRSDGRGQDPYLLHTVSGEEFRSKISTLRGDFRKEDGSTGNKLRGWDNSDFKPRPNDVFQERLYAIQWVQSKENPSAGKTKERFEFRSVTKEDLMREQIIEDYLEENFSEWQTNGWIPDMRIEMGYNTRQPIWERGWTYWHHLFNPRQLLLLGLVNRFSSARLKPAFFQLVQNNSKLSRWDNSGGGRAGVKGVFDNQALNTLYNYGSRALSNCLPMIFADYKSFPLSENINLLVEANPVDQLTKENDIYITDPPYGDAVKYEEILEFFIAWLRKNPPEEFKNWVWDSRRSLAIKGEDEGFRQGMVAAYRKMTQMMPDNGIQILMFTHQSGTIWADMANIIWASGLQVTAAWYVVTETDSALRQGANVKGTVILVLRKRNQELETFRDDLGWEIEEAVREQVESLIGLDSKVRAKGSEGLYNDADLQMAGYAAALKVLTAYSRIDGKDMVTEAEAPRQRGKKTFVDELIDFAVQTAVQFLVPVGFEKGEWQKLQPVERFYLKMAEMEHQGANTLDNYQNFAKAFKVHHFDQLMSDSSKANSARLKLSTEFKSAMMSGDAEIARTPLRALLYALFELSKEVEVEDVLLHLMENCPNYLPNKTLLSNMADYLAEKREGLKDTKTYKPDIEASCARILAEAIRNQRL
ncbi:DUF1156 domain-containing protein [Brevibacillus nitrificans]|uniref:DUF1156 domain-containing protein n=1 Tax=Brevibacillus nitrificans TaxID=651560 RepID=A0A3M8D366_9BACL|nr:anti-phage-associated DUF1156 domain-containing protein [Brevibacillus nitrificans]RNB82520.1 DUF1156 domain-containing protein [Brevibacillus nitrificans]